MDATDLETVEFDKISHSLTTFSHVVTVILSYLNAQDLNRCARVCSLWSKVARKQKRQRRSKAWTCLTLEPEEENKALVEKIKDFVLNLYTEPKVVFMFCQNDFYEESGCWCLADTVERGLNDYMRVLLPSSCTFVGVSSGGVVGSSPNLQQIYEEESEACVSILCLPDYDGVEVISMENGESGEDLSGEGTIISQFLQPQDKERCKAIFSFISEPYLSRQIGFDLMNEYTHSLIAGGYVDAIIVPGPQGEDISVLQCAALCGRNCQVASCVLRENVNTPRMAEESIKKLKTHNLSETNSFAFMFACVGRGFGMYNEQGVESSIFKKYFPKTPLFGFFGNGEIGFEFVSEKEERTVDLSEKKKKRKNPPRLYHAYTTILVLVSIT